MRAVGLRRAAGAAAGRRPRLVRRDGRRRGPRSTSTLPAERGDILDRNGEPLADSVDGLMVVADPTLTADRPPEIADVPRPSGSTSTTSRPCTRLRERGQPVRVPRPPGARRPSRREVVEEADERRLRGPRHPPRPGARLPGRRRRRQPGRLPRHRRAAGRLRAHLRQAALPAPTARRRYEVGGGNRIPLGESTVDRRRSTARTCRPPSTATCSGTPSGCCARPSRTRGAESGFAVVMDSRDRRDAGAGRLPDVRRQQPDCRRPRRDLGSRAHAATSTSPARSRRC